MNKPTLGKWKAQAHVNSSIGGIHYDIDVPTDKYNHINLACPMSEENAKFICTCANACQAINPAHPEYVAEQIEAMAKTIKDLLDGCELEPGRTDRTWSRQVPSNEAVVNAFKVLNAINKQEADNASS